MRLMLALAFCGFTAATTHAKEPAPRITVFVRSATAVDGFTDPNADNQKIAKDVRSGLTRRKLTVVDRQDDAAMILTVRGEIGSVLDPHSLLHVVHVHIQAGPVDTELITMNGRWLEAEQEMNDQLAKWAKANTSALTNGR